MTKHYISFTKNQPEKKPIQIEVALTVVVIAMTRAEATKIATQEVRPLKGYRLKGVN